jgi:hypothetical protein
MQASYVVRVFGSQANAGKALGMSQQAISYWVRNGNEVPKRWVPPDRQAIYTKKQADLRRKRNG